MKNDGDKKGKKMGDGIILSEFVQIIRLIPQIIKLVKQFHIHISVNKSKDFHAFDPLIFCTFRRRSLWAVLNLDLVKTFLGPRKDLFPYPLTPLG